MVNFTLLTANDIHISDNGPRSRKDNFRSTVLGKISQIRKLCVKLKADAMLLTGDLYNLKNPARNSHSLNQDLIKEFRMFPCPIFMIEGNHDLMANRLDSLSEQPLGVLFADGTLNQLRHHIIEKKDKGKSVKISLVGVPYIEKIDLKKLELPSKDDCVSQICLMHIYAGSKSGMLFKERLYGYEEFYHFDPDIFVFGHYHIDQGIEQAMGKYFVNIGSITRGTMSEEDINHHPQAGLINISVDELGNPSYEIKTIKLKIRPSSEIFDLTKREEEKKESQEIQLFVEKLAAELSNKPLSQNQSIDDLLNSMDVAKTVHDRVMHYIKEATGQQLL